MRIFLTNPNQPSQQNHLQVNDPYQEPLHTIKVMVERSCELLNEILELDIARYRSVFVVDPLPDVEDREYDFGEICNLVNSVPGVFQCTGHADEYVHGDKHLHIYIDSLVHELLRVEVGNSVNKILTKVNYTGSFEIMQLG